MAQLEHIEANDWILTSGRYVGVAPEEADENFDFEEALREIHVEPAATIKRNFEELRV
jgi:type I restriction enzyme M protein